MNLRLCMTDAGCMRCSAPLLSRDENALALCRDCDRDDEQLMIDYIEHIAQGG